jgi:hypothetical protein
MKNLFEEPSEQNLLENTVDLGFKSDYRKYYTVEAPNILCELWKLCYPGKCIRFESKQFTTLIQIVSDLYTCHKSGYDYVRYSRRNNDYSGSDNFSYSIVIKIIDSLVDNGYVIEFKGFRSKGLGRTSRMKASEKFISLFKNEYLPQSTNIVPCEDDNYVILKGFKEGKKAKIIPFEQTDTTKSWNNFLFKYNTLLCNSTLSLEEGYIPKEKINFDRIRVYRKFNDESFTKGGRLYGPWFQNCPKEARQHILINGVSSVEVDYSCMHPTLAYALNGIDVSKDLYAVNTIDNYQEHRKLIKKVVNICLNAKNKKSAIGAINNESLKHPNYTSTELVNLCTSYHSKISNMFLSDSGKRFMFEDSEIAIRILNHFMNQNILVLPVHDSFIVSTEHEQDLTTYMIQAFVSRTGKNINTSSSGYSIESLKPISVISYNTNNISSFSSFSSSSTSPEASSISSITDSLFTKPIDFLLTDSLFEIAEPIDFFLTDSLFKETKPDVFLLTDSLFEEPIKVDTEFTQPLIQKCILDTNTNEPITENNVSMSIRATFELQSEKVQRVLLSYPRELMENYLKKMAQDPTFFSDDRSLTLISL